jgi:hypothetical protein
MGWNHVKVIDPSTSEHELWAIIEFHSCASVRFGAPNDEAVHGHPLWEKGLELYAAHEVHNSPWLEEHIRINAVHPQHSEEPWRRLHHYMLLFHDEMLECLALGFTARLARTNLAAAMTETLASFTHPTR